MTERQRLRKLIRNPNLLLYKGQQVDNRMVLSVEVNEELLINLILKNYQRRTTPRRKDV